MISGIQNKNYTIREIEFNYLGHDYFLGQAKEKNRKLKHNLYSIHYRRIYLLKKYCYHVYN